MKLLFGELQERMGDVIRQEREDGRRRRLVGRSMCVEMSTGRPDVRMGLELPPLAGEIDQSDKTGGW